MVITHDYIVYRMYSTSAKECILSLLGVLCALIHGIFLAKVCVLSKGCPQEELPVPFKRVEGHCNFYMYVVVVNVNFVIM